MKRFFILLSVILTGFVLFSCKDQSQAQAKSNVDPLDVYLDSLRTAMLGKEFGNLVFRDSANNKFELQSLKGNIVAINVWAFGCKPCMEEMPKLNVLVDKYKNEPVKFLSIMGSGKNLNFKDTTFIRLYKQIHFKYLTVATDRGLNELYNFQSLYPQHIILDKKGCVIDYFAGPLTERLDSIINIYK